MSSENTKKTKIKNQDDSLSLLESKHLESAEDFETLLEKAKAVLNRLNSQEITLKESLALYESGTRSLKDAQKILEQAKLQYQEFKD